uniref:Uncharacterized protein n=2 Tax=Kalmanozyma brasiliensis (strain GHG001) TaxID=1365824 RepID=V5ED75_KALBG
MQKLQDKVKGRLAAKGTPLPPTAPPSKAKLRASASLRGSLSRRGGKLGRNGSIKRSASSISTSESADRASAPAVSRADGPARETAVAQKSATPNTDPPAAKVRRTSVSIAQPPLADQLATQTSKSASPMPTRKSSPPKTIEEAIAKSVSPKPTVSKSSSPGNKSVHTPSSIEAALLSPTDTPTPSEAAASHAQTLSKSPVPPEGAVEAPTGQALPADLPAAGQMNAGSATTQQSTKVGADSLVQAAQSKDPTETSSAMA